MKMQLNVSYYFTLETLSWKNLAEHIMFIFYSQHFCKLRYSNSINFFSKSRVKSMFFYDSFNKIMPALIDPIHFPVLRT